MTTGTITGDTTNIGTGAEQDEIGVLFQTLYPNYVLATVYRPSVTESERNNDKQKNNLIRKLARHCITVLNAIDPEQAKRFDTAFKDIPHHFYQLHMKLALSQAPVEPFSKEWLGAMKTILKEHFEEMGFLYAAPGDLQIIIKTQRSAEELTEIYNKNKHKNIKAQYSEKPALETFCYFNDQEIAELAQTAGIEDFVNSGMNLDEYLELRKKYERQEPEIERDSWDDATQVVLRPTNKTNLFHLTLINTDRLEELLTTIAKYAPGEITEIPSNNENIELLIHFDETMGSLIDLLEQFEFFTTNIPTQYTLKHQDLSLLEAKGGHQR